MNDIHAARTDHVQSDHSQTNVNTAYGPKVGVGVLLIDERGRILLTLRKRPPEAGCWSIVGGKLGVEIAIERLLCVTDHCLREEGQHWVAPAYLGRILSGEATNRDPTKPKRSAGSTLISYPPLTMTARNAVAAYHRRA